MEDSIIYNTKEVFYKKNGSGDPVVLVHGFGEDGTIWDHLVETLEPHYKVYVPDLPGTGKSPSGISVSIAGFADIISLIMQNEGLKKISLIGHSMGGYISMSYAMKNADLLTSLTLFHSSAYADDEEKKAARLKSIAFIKGNGSRAFLKTSVPALFKDPTLHQEKIDKLINAPVQPQTLVSYYEAMIARVDTSPILSQLNCPVLFLLGEHDKAVPLEIGLRQCHLPVISHVHILKDSAHMGMIEQKDKTSVIIKDFLHNLKVQP
jgi:pimeloyl-ACP methyl ester carboxylesterase